MAESDEPTPSKRSRFLRRSALILLVAVFLLSLYNIATLSLMKKHDNSPDRDPETGIIVGAEPITIGPESADTAILFVHGFVGARDNFWEVPQQLADKGYRVRLMLHAGHGTTPQEFDDTPTSDLLDHVVEEIHALQENHDKVILVGHSMGGALSTIAASTEDIDGLVLAAPYFGVTHQWYYVLPVEFWGSLTNHFIHRVYKGDAFIRVKRPEAKSQIMSYRWIPAKGAASLIRIGNQAKNADTLKSITAPVLHIHGKDDFAASPEEAQKAVAKMSSKQKTTILLENSDHHIFWDYDREQVSEVILKFVCDIDTTP